MHSTAFGTGKPCSCKACSGRSINLTLTNKKTYRTKQPLMKILAASDLHKGILFKSCKPGQVEPVEATAVLQVITLWFNCPKWSSTQPMKLHCKYCTIFIRNLKDIFNKTNVQYLLPALHKVLIPKLQSTHKKKANWKKPLTQLLYIVIELPHYIRWNISVITRFFSYTNLTTHRCKNSTVNQRFNSKKIITKVG